MKRTRWLLGLACLLSSLGCATRAVHVDSILQNGPSVPLVHTVPNVEFVDQDTYYCGPAVVTMTLRWNGVAADVAHVAEKVFTPGLEGSLPMDVISAHRRYGMLAMPVNSLSSLLKEVAANNPVIVFQNLALSWAPQWHYALVVGYDLTQKKIILHSGHHAYVAMDINDFEYTWNLADHWGLVVVSPDKLASSASELDHVKAAVALEQMKNVSDAEISYQRILEKWPNNLVALIGAANIAYQKGNRGRAIHWLRHAVKFHPKSVAAKNNLSIALASEK